MTDATHSKSYQENKEHNPLPETGISPSVKKSSADANNKKTRSDSAAGKILSVEPKT